MSKHEKNLKDFQQALEDGNVNLPEDFSSEVYSDGECRLLVGNVPDMTVPTVALTFVDGGGFSGLYLTKAGWEKTKAEIDSAFIRVENSVQ